LGHLSGSGPVELGGWEIPFTVFSAVGVINALNMIDGLDGLAGSLALVALVSLSFTVLHSGHSASAHLLLIAVAVVVAFLLFNLRFSERRPARVFMGDSGSMFLGFVLTWYVIELSQGPVRVIAPVTALWVLAIPLFDAVYIMFRRMLMGLSPFAADRDHLHHLLQTLGLSAVQTLVVIVTAAVVLALFGLYGLYHGFSEARMFYGFLGLFALYFAGMNLAWWRLRTKRHT
ncbi:MAG TPA: undecaprenyl/decaprenyl-phosphate alpha-N-acetylglucosaminyl 1-phosphate transferase, partial [Gammaproteobacteria bacterium]|nr:undecaprenyl/decaprenyl-phosphate alpha-N-acetylglucosaminyl 1-phosphate transferase [Gammaproteobacteria bacterium]